MSRWPPLTPRGGDTTEEVASTSVQAPQGPLGMGDTSVSQTSPQMIMLFQGMIDKARAGVVAAGPRLSTPTPAAANTPEGHGQSSPDIRDSDSESDVEAQPLNPTREETTRQEG